MKVKFIHQKIYCELALLPKGLETVRSAAVTAHAFDSRVEELRAIEGDWVIEIDKQGKITRSFDLDQMVPKVMVSKEILKKHGAYTSELFHDYVLGLRDTIEQGEKITVSDFKNVDLFDVVAFDAYFNLHYPNKIEK